MATTHIYRQSKLGDSLVEALDTLVEEGKIPGPLALRVLQEVRGDSDHHLFLHNHFALTCARSPALVPPLPLV
jgi:hypothetical protein